MNVCPVCNGSGILHPVDDSGKPDYSRVVACQCVRQVLENEKQSVLERFSSLGMLKRYDFDNLVPEGLSGNPVLQERFTRAVQAARQFASHPSGWFILSGPSGCGKTHLAAAIANERIKQGQPALYTAAPDFLDHLRNAFSPGTDMGYDEFFDRVRSAPLLVLDDLGAQSGTAWATEKLDQLLTFRFNAELPTVIVLTGTLTQLDDRLRTRLTDPRLCQVHEFEEGQTSGYYAWDPEFKAQEKMTFAAFDWHRVNLPYEQRQNVAEAFRVATEFARSPEGWLILQGDNGCGKTHLAAAIVNFRYEAKQPALFRVVPDFLDHLRQAFSPESKVSYDDYFESVKKAPVLVLDDFGEQSSTPWAREKLYQVINYRYNARLPTIITTTLTLEKMENRVSSRFVDPKLSVFFNIVAPDYRGDAPPRENRPPRRRPPGRQQG